MASRKAPKCQPTRFSVFFWPIRPDRKEMSKPQVFLQCLLLLLCAELFHFTLADVGVAAQYRPPYLPTACSGNDPSPFPSSNLFAAAGEGAWDNGAACGRQYRVRCISAPTPGTCKADQTIVVKIVDRAQTSVSRPSRDGAALVLSTTAFGAIANPSAAWVNVEFAQV
ncbi:EG45-like domain containing protein isoform X1 [Vitis riparia]|uniref:EG45-like domain containing protein isoform X1 n=2 Tax=Vitis riparia TaxID=96939 RepID=UPI00155A3434|nr:EG45-like domain containing protein isoform X1 [Vitis riparia]